MGIKLEKYAYSLLSRLSFTNNREKYLYLLSLAACTYGTIMNLFLLIFHFASGVYPLYIVSTFGLLIDICLFRLVNKGHYLPFGILLTWTVMVHVISSAICIGTNNFIALYLLVTVMMQVIIPYARIAVRILMIIALWACMIALIFINCYVVPFWDIGAANVLLTLFNVYLAFFVTIIQLTIGNFIRSMIIKFNEKELEKSKNEANMDALTGLFNRRYADELFENLKNISDPLERTWCVAMLDLDDFKVINDTYGHQVGDDVLIWISKFIKTNLRKIDLVFRWGGEEFLILLKGINISTAFRTLDNLRSKLELESLEIPQGEIIKITVTIGVCSLDVDKIKQSIDMCDHLMYKGKTSGKNVVIM
ncbi:MAG TPA: GGDEF domain-containing protein [Clostridiaceae bacterium]|nr:GGDEF domain-containing protein [Clostridiaceae bacterium]